MYSKIAEHNGVHYIYFYQGRISNFHVEPFWGKLDEEELVKFCCGEQYIMARKAILMGDDDACVEIMAETSPLAIKKLGRRVKNWNQALWDENVEQIARDVCEYRMLDENRTLTPYGEAMVELATKYEKYMFVEAAPHDAIWGIGARAEVGHSHLLKFGEFKGRNILGRAITSVVMAILDP